MFPAKILSKETKKSLVNQPIYEHLLDYININLHVVTIATLEAEL